MKQILVLILFLVNSPRIAGQELEINWTFNTGSKVLASPVLYQNNILIGDEDGTFYSIDSSTGKDNWTYETGGIIQAQALVFNDKVFLESANIFYLLDANTGDLIWEHDIEMSPFTYDPNAKEPLYKIDPWDDMRSSAIIHNGIIYAGAGNGYIYGFQAESGEVAFKLGSINLVPIRSTPMIQKGHLYFGDWDARVYKYDLESKDFDWIKRMYRGNRPYPSFGGIVSGFLIHNNRLYFGARNHMLNVLYTETGEKEWTYADPNGGWIVTDPVINNDTLFIGGSDNFTMFAFSTRDGRLLWAQNGGKNIYTKPLLIDSNLIYTSGNGYDADDTGIVYLLNRTNGVVIDSLEIPKGVFSSPVQQNKSIFFGSYDGNVYSVSVKE